MDRIRNETVLWHNITLKNTRPAGIRGFLASILLVVVLFAFRSTRRKKFCIGSETRNKALDFSQVKQLPDFDVFNTTPHPYRPWKAGRFSMTMGIRKMAEDEWLTIDKLYAKEQDFKEHLLKLDSSEVVQCLPNAETACVETLQCVVSFLTRRYPRQFYLLLDRPGYIYNAITKKTLKVVAPWEQHPLIVAAQLAMEDINLLMQGCGDEVDEYSLQASFTFAPIGWYIKERMGWPLWKIHSPVPLWNEKLKKAMEKFFLGLKVSSPVERNNFFIQTNSNLFQQESLPARLPTQPSIDEIHVRYERQTLRRLPISGAILFMVRTYLTPLTELRDERESIHKLREATRAWPQTIAEYKGREAWESVFEKWCEEVLNDYVPDS